MAFRSRFAPEDRRRTRTKLILALVGVLAVVVGLAVWRVGPAAELELETSVPGIGTETTVVGSASEPGRGLSGLRLELVQGERTWTLGEAEHEPRPFWAFWGEAVTDDRLEAVVDGTELEGLEEGEARLRLVAERAPTWLRYPDPAVEERTVPVRFRPPAVDLGPGPVRVRQGGSGLVVYRVGEAAVESGVRTPDHFFPGYPVPGGGPRDRFSLFAVPYDQGDPSGLRLVARDELGNELAVRFVTAFRAKPLKRSTIRLDDRFLEKVVGEITSRTTGLPPADEPLEAYLAINGDLRRRNAEELEELARDSAAELLWAEAFRQQPNSQLMDDFAARRTYLYDGREVDTQDHLGLDLASVRRAPVIASNGGRVLLARYFGIYGNTVVLDHGYGLLSLYAHLSAIDVDEGESVSQGQELGRSGETGLAGGDHLHFSILVGGHPVDPLEWLDASWIDTRIAAALPGLDLELELD